MDPGRASGGLRRSAPWAGTAIYSPKARLFVTDFLDDKRKEIARRLAELAPVAAEYKRLTAAAEALAAIPPSKNGAPAAHRAVSARGRTSRRRGSKSANSPAARVSVSKTKPQAKSRRGRRKGGGKRSAQALTFVQEQPGITIPDLARRMTVHPTYLYKVLPTFADEGKIVRDGRGWYPKEAAPTVA